MIKKLSELENIFRRQIMVLLGFDPDVQYPAGDPVRISWPAEGQPDINVGDDVIYVKLYDAGGQEIARTIFSEARYAFGQRLETRSQTRVWRLELIAYGPGSYDALYLVKRKLQQNEGALLRSEEIFLVPQPLSPQRAPEYKNSLWFERSDLMLVFYENATEETAVPAIREVTVNISLNGSNTDVIEGSVTVTDPEQ